MFFSVENVDGIRWNSVWAGLYAAEEADIDQFKDSTTSINVNPGEKFQNSRQKL
jgi:hypothetical protein